MTTFVTYSPNEVTELLIKTGAPLAAQQEIERLRAELTATQNVVAQYAEGERKLKEERDIWRQKAIEVLIELGELQRELRG